MRGLTLALPEAIKLIAAGKLKKKIRIQDYVYTSQPNINSRETVTPQWRLSWGV